MNDITSAGRPRHRLTVGRKLAAGMLVLTVLTCFLGIFAIERLRSINTAMQTVSEDRLPGMGQASLLSYTIQEARRNEYRLGLSTGKDPLEVAAASAKIGKMMDEARKARTASEPYIDDGEERQHYTDDFDRYFGPYQESIQQLVNDAQDGKVDAVRKRLADERNALYEPMLAFFKWDINYNRRTGAQTAAVALTDYRHALVMILVVLVAVLALSVGLSIYLTRHVGGATAQLAEAMRRLAGGNKTIDIPGVGRRDEVGEMADAVHVFKDNMIRADELAAADRESRVARQKRSEELENLVGDFETKAAKMVDILASASTEMEATAREMSGTLVTTGEQATIVADAARNADHGVQNAASAAEQLSGSIREITRQVSNTAQQASKVADDAKRTDEVVARLADASTRVGQIVDLISSIAAQTNLLALNATIEAARAGEAGKGFAVVASEVKSLAQQTAKATEGVGEQVAQIRQATDAAVTALASIVSGIDDISRATVTVAAAVEEQGAATGEIARNVQQTAGSTRTVSDNIVEVSRLAQDNGAAAAQVMASAGELSQQAETLNREVTHFLRLVKNG